MIFGGDGPHDSPFGRSPEEPNGRTDRSIRKGRLAERCAGFNPCSQYVTDLTIVLSLTTLRGFEWQTVHDEWGVTMFRTRGLGNRRSRLLTHYAAQIALAVATGMLAVVFAPTARAHVTYACGSDIYGVCEYFRGYTQPADTNTTIDPINIAWTPYGTTLNVVNSLWDVNWRWTDASIQYNRRLMDDGTGGYAYRVGEQDASRATEQAPFARYHARSFFGHSEGYADMNWSVSDAHHESCCTHAIDQDWDDVEWYLVGLMYDLNRATESYWTYLPLGEGNFQGYHSDGWASRIDALGQGA